jgi:hypothetical protein
MYMTEVQAFPDFTAISNTCQIHCQVANFPEFDSGNKTVTFYH